MYVLIANNHQHLKVLMSFGEFKRQRRFPRLINFWLKAYNWETSRYQSSKTAHILSSICWCNKYRIWFLEYAGKGRGQGPAITKGKGTKSQSKKTIHISPPSPKEQQIRPCWGWAKWKMREKKKGDFWVACLQVSVLSELYKAVIIKRQQ